MCGFKTRNSVYTLDSVKRQISGGVLGKNSVPYVRAVALIGLPAEIELENGKVIRTSTVQSYI